ncbi:hypothetical protein [Hydrogenophaga sp.]|uniref:hypothetical protein n=1 Tax=Hydrogenophaga sp. TaxID=1904254 RepID=UPI003D0CA2E7
MLKHKPCAYCGSKAVPRGKGHVFPRSIYPDTLPDAKRITVPECETCKAIWEDAEPHFRNVLLSIWDPEVAPLDNRTAKLWRSFDELDGSRRIQDLSAMLRPAHVDGQERAKIYPDEDERFNLILRRIVRGLSHEHRLGTAIPDSAVVSGVMRWIVPPAFEPSFSWHTIAPDFISYAYARVDESHTFWLLRFSRHITFFASIGPVVGVNRPGFRAGRLI